MTFQKNHRLGFFSENPLDRTAISVKGRVGQREALKKVPNWQAQIRDLIDDLIDRTP